MKEKNMPYVYNVTVIQIKYYKHIGRIHTYTYTISG